MKKAQLRVSILTGLFVSSSVSLAAAPLRVIGNPQLDRPTLHSLGVYWIVPDVSRDASVYVGYRKAGTSTWLEGARLVRVEPKAHLMERFGSSLKLPEDGWLFAGSVLLLQPGTKYELLLTLLGGRGGGAAVSPLLRSNAVRACGRFQRPQASRHAGDGRGHGNRR